MKSPLSDAQIIAARPIDHKANSAFTDKVMKSIVSSEILSSQVRKMSVNKKETLFMKLQLLPKFAIVMIAIATLLVLSGTTYAAYKLFWIKPEIHVSTPSTAPNGRKEFEISFAQCGSDWVADGYELKSNATITAAEVPMVVKAQCELNAIRSWAEATYPHDSILNHPMATEAYDSVRVSTSMATHIKSRDISTITFDSLTEYNQTDISLANSKTVTYIADSKTVAAGAITSADPVAYITSTKLHMVPSSDCTKQSCSYSSTDSEITLLAIVKLSGEFKYYDQFAWQSLTERQNCNGNPADSCLTGYIGAIDIYSGPPIPSSGSAAKEIQGIITNINGKTITIRSSSGAIFTLATPTDIVAAYNDKRAARYYNNQTVNIGSSLTVRYAEDANLRSKDLSSDTLMSIQLQLEMISKGDPVKSY